MQGNNPGNLIILIIIIINIIIVIILIVIIIVIIIIIALMVYEQSAGLLESCHLPNPYMYVSKTKPEKNEYFQLQSFYRKLFQK